jgi:hypothetical protein
MSAAIAAVHESGIGTFRTCRSTRRMSVVGGKSGSHFADLQEGRADQVPLRQAEAADKFVAALLLRSVRVADFCCPHNGLA